MDPNDMRVLFAVELQAIEMNSYPSCLQLELAINFNSHYDASGLTILLQVNEIQIRKSGVWVPIKPFPNAFVINLEDCMEIISNGIYKSVDHCATVNSVKESVD
ncbi:hypothetical protein like AT4G25310 [Hibiscus trionum]|uniref:Fe2OG dioxygenase domain-containing protein n=1 Tax=Hibiscus trionum TaxID=183268 RepID=A0A9W7H8E2_HIBTR|nr:hypothetical protein like AT4G25310 [Hibiscus trionum]